MSVSGNVAYHLHSAKEGNTRFLRYFSVTEKVIFTFIIMLSIPVIIVRTKWSSDMELLPYLLCRERHTWWCSVDMGLSFVLSRFTAVCHAQLLSCVGRCLICCAVCLHAILQTVALSAHWSYRQATQGLSCNLICSAISLSKHLL